MLPKFDFYTSDLHTCHTNIIRYCNRPFLDLADQEKKIIKNFNSVVGPNDNTLFLGDMWFNRRHTKPGYMNQFNGTKFLLRGNHDKDWTDQQLLDFGFTDVYPSDFIDGVDGHEVRYSHYPFADATQDDRYRHLRPPKEDPRERTLIHGHTHETHRITKYNTIHVGVDAWNYHPVSRRELVAAIEELKGQYGKEKGQDDSGRDGDGTDSTGGI